MLKLNNVTVYGRIAINLECNTGSTFQHFETWAHLPLCCITFSQHFWLRHKEANCCRNGCRKRNAFHSYFLFHNLSNQYRYWIVLYQTVPADWIAGCGMSITVTTSAGAKIGATGDTLKTRGTHLTRQAWISSRTSGNESAIKQRYNSSILITNYNVTNCKLS